MKLFIRKIITIGNNVKISQLSLLVSFIIFTCGFLVTRLAFLYYYNIHNFSVDYLSYFTIVDQLDRGMLPNLSIRTPGYPLFLKLVFTFVSKNSAVVVVQNSITFAVSLFFIYVIYKKYKSLCLFAAIALIAFVSSSVHLKHDTTLLAESLYVNAMLLFFALLILAIRYNSILLWILCSVDMAYAILLRPVGIILIIHYLLILIFLFRNSYKKRILWAFGIPFISILLLLLLYNYFTVKSFALTCYSENFLLPATATYLEPSPDYDAKVNGIITVSRDLVKKKDKEIINKSWDLFKLHFLFSQYYEKSRIKTYRLLASYEDKDSFGIYMKWRPLLRKISLAAIRKHPSLALKFTLSNSVAYFNNITTDAILRKFIEREDATPRKTPRIFVAYDQYMKFYLTKEDSLSLSKDFLKKLLKENNDLAPIPELHTDNLHENYGHEYGKSYFKKLYSIFSAIHASLFRNIIWAIFFFAALIFSFVKLLRTRGRHKGSFILFAITSAAFFNAILVCSIELPYLRYSYTHEFAFYFSLFLFPIALMPDHDFE